jgi:hypothetical protein
MPMFDLFPIQVMQEKETLRFEWSNRHVSKDNYLAIALILFWLMWAPATVFATGLAVESANFCVAAWCVCAWLGTLLIPYCLLGRAWLEWIEITPDSIAHGFQGFLCPRRKVYSLASGAVLWCEGSDGDPALSLYLPVTSGIEKQFVMMILSRWPELKEQAKSDLTKWAASFGYWLSPRLKEQIFLAIAEFTQTRAIPLECKRR